MLVIRRCFVSVCGGGGGDGRVRMGVCGCGCVRGHSGGWRDCEFLVGKRTQIIFPSKQLHKPLHALLAVSLHKHVAIVLLVLKQEAIGSAAHAQQMLQRIIHANGLAIDKHTRDFRTRKSNERREWIHLQWGSYHEQEIALGEVGFGQLEEAPRQRLSKEDDIGLDETLTQRAAGYLGWGGEHTLPHALDGHLGATVDAARGRERAVSFH